jgi:ketosteroid isomerase-like protein
MKRAALIVAFLAGTLAASGQEAPAGPPAAEEARAAIAANHSKFVGAFGKRDAAAVAALHADDAKLLPQGGRPVEGVRNVEAFWGGLLKAGARLVQLQTLSVEERGELAYEVGDYIVTTQPSPGLTAINSGSYLVVWRRQGAEWKLAAAIWNTGEAAPER